MARILAIDTTSESGSLALVGNAGVVEEISLHSSEGFSHVLYGHIEQLLARHGLGLDRIDCFAGAAGPGSFTGVRVGLAAVKGLGETTGKPVAAVSNLQALAWFGAGPLRAVLIDARRGEIYGAVYNAALEPVCSEVVTKLENWIGSLPAGDIEFITNGSVPLRGAIAGTHHAESPVREAPAALAGAVGRIAMARFQAGQTQDPAAIDANYVRRSDAELFWKEP